MFSHIPSEVIEQMRRLEAMDSRDRIDGTPRMERLRQVPPDTGRFLAILAAVAPKGTFIEIGTSAGYSGLYIGLACREVGARLITFEVLEAKAKMAEETFRLAGMTDVIDLRLGDAREQIGAIDNIAFCFLDAEKEIYCDCYELVVPKMAPGGLLVADNVISQADILKVVVEQAAQDPRVDSVVVPIGKGELLCRRRSN